jgi:2-polyprenyl-6-methoxyphenol hydroxylase-like FAD-dependent oxidoreductase
VRLRHAVVIGGSATGLSCAAALASRAERVTLIERDRFPEGVGPRRGVPQARHVHALLQRGRDEMNALFPGFDEAMRGRGVPELDYGLDYATLRAWGWVRRMPTGIKALYPSRDCVDAVLRELLARRENVTVLEGLHVVELLGAGSPATRVRGVRVRDADDRDAEARDLEADLVVDASGRGSRAPAWVQALGREAPAEQRVDAQAAYASRWFRRRPIEGQWWKAAWVDPEPPHRKLLGVLFPTEGDRVVATIAAYGGEAVPETDEEFDEFLATRFPSPILARSLEGAEPLSSVVHNRSTSNQWRRWDGLRDPLPGLVVVGDAACAFNPVYGQGMSVASACASLLGCAVAEAQTPEALPAAFFQRQARLVRSVWDIATGADVVWPTTTGERAVAPRLLAPYLATLGSAMLDDEDLTRRVLRVFHLVDDATVLFSPPVLAKVAAEAVRQRWSPRPAPGPMPPLPA